MTREDVLKLFPEATDDQVTKLLNQNNSEVAGEKKKAEKYKSDNEKLKIDAEKALELQSRLDTLENEKLTEEQKREKEQEKFREELNVQLEQFKKANDDLQNQLNSERIKGYAVSKNLTGENIDTILKSFGSNYDLAVAAIDSMAQLISERETAAALAKERQIANSAGNPGGQSGGSGDGNSIATNMAIASAKRAGNANEKILNSYRR